MVIDDDADAYGRAAVTLAPGEGDAWGWALLDASTDAIVVTDADGRVRGWNRQAMALYGYDPDATVGRHLLEIPPFEGPTGLGPLLEERLATAPTSSPATFACSADGRGVAVRRLTPASPQAAPRAGAAGGGLVVMVREETPSDEGEEVGALQGRIERGRALLDTMLRQLAIGLVIVEAPSGRLLMDNDEAKRFLGRTALSSMKEAVERGEGAEHPDGRPYRVSELPLTRALKGEAVRREEMVYRRADGAPLHFSVNAAPVRAEDGTDLFAVATFDDITDRRTKERALRSHEEELARVNQRLFLHALHDVLTGLPNRTLLLDRLEQVLQRRVEAPHRDAAVLFLDFDRFKIVNDSLGHAVGDAMLVAIARLLAQVVRPEDTVARLGGDEFVILMDHVDGTVRSTALADRIQALFETPIEVEGHRIYTSTSIGIVASMVGYEDSDAVLRDADTAMYHAKGAGGGGRRVFDQCLRDEALAMLELETALRQAVARNEFQVGYGPIHRLDTRKVVGFEALVRWQHPRRGLLTANEFLSVAHDMGLERQIDLQVWREANRTVAAWRDRFDRRLLLSLNVSKQHFLSAEPEKPLLDVLDETGADPEQTVVELAAGTANDVPKKAAPAVLKLVDRGIGVHLDDFGTAQTSLVSLQGFHAAALKMDQGLVERMIEDEKSAELVRTIFAMADSLDLDVVAKGVATEAQCRRLAELGCTYAQGPFFAFPLDEEETTRLLEAQADAWEGPDAHDG